MARKTPLPFTPEDFPVRSGALAARLAEIDDADTIVGLQRADSRASSIRVYEGALEVLRRSKTAPAHPNPIVEAKPAHPAAKAETTRRAYLNPRISAATIRIAGRSEPVEVTAENRAEIEGATVTLTDGRTVPLFEIRG